MLEESVPHCFRFIVVLAVGGDAKMHLSCRVLVAFQSIWDPRNFNVLHIWSMLSLQYFLEPVHKNSFPANALHTIRSDAEYVVHPHVVRTCRCEFVELRP